MMKYKRRRCARVNIGRMKLFKRLIIVALIFVLVVGEASAAVSTMSVSSFSAKKVNVYVRAFVPGNRTPWKSIGHFDMMIEGVFEFRGKTFKNPVFTYRMEDSCLAVFNEADTGKYYAHSSPADYYYDCDLYQARFITVDYNTVKNFLKQLNNSIASSTKYSGGVKCRFKSSSEFSRYKTSSTNCFYAVAAWLKSLGSSSLMNYYYGAHSGKYAIYTPKNLVKAYSGKFRLKYAG